MDIAIALGVIAALMTILGIPGLFASKKKSSDEDDDDWDFVL